MTRPIPSASCVIGEELDAFHDALIRRIARDQIQEGFLSDRIRCNRPKNVINLLGFTVASARTERSRGSAAPMSTE